MTEILVYYGDDFAGWMAAGNPDHLPVVQCQTPAITQPPPSRRLGTAPTEQPPAGRVAGDPSRGDQ